MKILILAAGKGSRFKAGPKIFAPFWGTRVIDLIAAQVGRDFCVVVSEDVASNVPYEKIIQCGNYGTGAALQAYLDGSIKRDLLVIPGDAPLINEDVITSFENASTDINADVIVGIMKTPEGEEQYGRVIIENGAVKQVVEYAHHKQKTDFVNTGMIYMNKRAQKLSHLLQKSATDEIYLTDIVNLANKHGLKVGAVQLRHDQALGFNTVEEFHNLLGLAQIKWRTAALRCGAVFYDINTVYLNFDTKFEAGAIIEPNCRFGPGVSVKEKAHIKSFSVLEDCVVNGTVGPFAYVKSGMIEEAVVGSFVEIKNSHIKKSAKIKHLAYIGDAQVGENTNIGAGVVICNFNGQEKSKTVIGNGVFVGANSSLIAPINIGDSAFLAAGGVFTKDVEKNNFAIARSKQITRIKKRDV